MWKIWISLLHVLACCLCFWFKIYASCVCTAVSTVMIVFVSYLFVRTKEMSCLVPSHTLIRQL